MPREERDRGRSGQGREPSGPRHGLDASAIKADVLGLDPTKIDVHAEELAQAIVQAGLATSQIRNFYGAFARLRAERDLSKQRGELALHRSRLAYLTARAEGKANALWDVFGLLLREAAKGANEKQVSALCDFAEAVVAYHKFYEKSQKRKY